MPTGPIRGHLAAAADEHYARTGTDQQDLVDRYPGMARLADEQLIGIVADPPAGVGLMGDADEVTAVAAIMLERRLSARGGGAQEGVAAGLAAG